jgi:pyroglutamyl-peptidase
MTLIPMNNFAKKILITGFEPFDGDCLNPSGVLLDWLNSKAFDFEIRTELLPVSFTNAYPVLEKALQEFNPTHVILTGFAKNRTELTIERIAINWVDARIPDNDGLTLKSQKIKEESEDGLFTNLPIEKMLAAARSTGCPTKISTTAGEYVCNHLIYLFLTENKKVPGTFIHIPGACEHEIFFQGISAILTALE